MNNTNELLSQGITALKAGQKAKARSLLKQVIEQDKFNESAWLWLSGAVDTDEERRTCLQKAVSINPNSKAARLGLQRLDPELTTANKTQQLVSKPHQTQPTPTMVKQEARVEPPSCESNGSAKLKKCPYCAEEIRDEAIVCRYCGRDLRAPAAQPVQTKQRPSQPAKQSLSGGDVLLAFLLPIVGLVVAVVYLLKPQSRERGLLLVVVSLITWAVWWVLCSLTGSFSSGYRF